MSILCSSEIKGIDNQERLVYQVIESAGNKGIWTRDIRHKCNLMLTEVNKILKNLEGKKLIKSVKSVAVSRPTSSRLSLCHTLSLHSDLHSGFQKESVHAV